MRIRVEDVIVEDYSRGLEPFPRLSDAQEIQFLDFPGAEVPGYHHAIDMRIDEHNGLPVIWFRLAVPIVDGEVSTAFQRLASLCDWTYSIHTIVHQIKNNTSYEDETVFSINPDTTINYFRPPSGEWICMKAQASYGDLGCGCVCAQLFDQDGPVGFCTQSVLNRSVGNSWG